VNAPHERLHQLRALVRAALERGDAELLAIVLADIFREFPITTNREGEPDFSGQLASASNNDD